MAAVDAPSLCEIIQLTHSLLTTKQDDDEIRECGRPALELLDRNAGICIQLAYQKLHDVPYREVKRCWRRLYTDAVLWKVLTILEKIGDAGEDEQEIIREADCITEAVKSLDMALILTAAPLREELIELIFSALQALISKQEQEQTLEPGAKRRKFDTARQFLPRDHRIPNSFSSTIDTPPALHIPIPRLSNLSFSAFQARISSPNLQFPIIITDAINHWPALDERPWSRPSYLLERTLGGRRLVPVEVGRTYTDEGWGQRILSFRDFVGKYLVDIDGEKEDEDDSKTSTYNDDKSFRQPENPVHNRRHSISTQSAPSRGITQIGYLAQHDLFAQIPSLRSDIMIPDYCYSTPPSPSPPSPSKSVPTLEDPLLNAWFGPAGTISPLHTDPYHNILAQVVGSKYVRLYSPEQGEKLWPRGTDEMGVDMSNTSSVDLDHYFSVHPEMSPWGYENGAGGGNEVLDQVQRNDFEERFKGFKDAEYVEGVLGPGECLYIPVGWWHYVRSLTTSFSVSFWFN